jgi:hypothetical protein
MAKKDLNRIADEIPEQKDLFKENLNNIDWLGVVVDNEDPLFLGRCKVKVFEKYDNIPIELIPWAFPSNSNVFAGGESKGYGSFSYPKIGHFVRVKFNGGDKHHPEYYFIENINKKMQNEIKESYVNCQVVVYDEDEDLKIIYTQSNGLMMWHKESFVNIDKNVNIHIVHAGKPSEMHFVEDKIHIKSDTEILSETTNNYRNATSEIIDKTMYHYMNSPLVHVGTNATFSATKCEMLMALFTTLAAMIDTKAPVTPGVATSAVSSAMAGICSMTVKIAN